MMPVKAKGGNVFRAGRSDAADKVDSNQGSGGAMVINEEDEEDEEDEEVNELVCAALLAWVYISFQYRVQSHLHPSTSPLFWWLVALPRSLVFRQVPRLSMEFMTRSMTSMVS